MTREHGRRGTQLIRAAMPHRYSLVRQYQTATVRAGPGAGGRRLPPALRHANARLPTPCHSLRLPVAPQHHDISPAGVRWHGERQAPLSLSRDESGYSINYLDTLWDAGAFFSFHCGHGRAQNATHAVPTLPGRGLDNGGGIRAITILRAFHYRHTYTHLPPACGGICRRGTLRATRRAVGQGHAPALPRPTTHPSYHLYLSSWTRCHVWAYLQARLRWHAHAPLPFACRAGQRCWAWRGCWHAAGRRKSARSIAPGPCPRNMPTPQAGAGFGREPRQCDRAANMHWDSGRCGGGDKSACGGKRAGTHHHNCRCNHTGTSHLFGRGFLQVGYCHPLRLYRFYLLWAAFSAYRTLSRLLHPLPDSRAGRNARRHAFQQSCAFLPPFCAISKLGTLAGRARVPRACVRTPNTFDAPPLSRGWGHYHAAWHKTRWPRRAADGGQGTTTPITVAGNSVSLFFRLDAAVAYKVTRGRR